MHFTKLIPLSLLAIATTSFAHANSTSSSTSNSTSNSTITSLLAARAKIQSNSTSNSTIPSILAARAKISSNSTSNSTTTSIVAAITKIQAKTLSLNQTVASWNGAFDPLGTIPIVLDSTSLLSALNDGTLAATHSPNLTVAQTLSVAAAITPLVSDVQSTLDTIVAARSSFGELLLTQVIHSNLVKEKAATDKFSAAVMAKMPSAEQTLASNFIALIDTAFNSAIAAFE